MRACGLPFRYARVIPVTHPFRKERENDGAPAPMPWKKSQVMCLPERAGHPPGGASAPDSPGVRAKPLRLLNESTKHYESLAGDGDTLPSCSFVLEASKRFFRC